MASEKQMEKWRKNSKKKQKRIQRRSSDERRGNSSFVERLSTGARMHSGEPVNL